MGDGPCERCGHDGAEHGHAPWWRFWRRVCFVLVGTDDVKPDGFRQFVYCGCAGFRPVDLGEKP